MVLKEEVGQGLCDAIWAPGEAMLSQKYLHTLTTIIDIVPWSSQLTLYGSVLCCQLIINKTFSISAVETIQKCMSMCDGIISD